MRYFFASFSSVDFLILKSLNGKMEFCHSEFASEIFCINSQLRKAVVRTGWSSKIKTVKGGVNLAKLGFFGRGIERKTKMKVRSLFH